MKPTAEKQGSGTEDAPSPGPSEVSVRAGAPRGEPADLAGAPRPRLLLIEDDWRTHSALRKIFTKLGWEVHSVMTAHGGMALLEIRPQGVVLDIMLPDGDGLAVLRKIRSELVDTRVVVTTGVEDNRRLEEIRQYRPAALLRKPLELADLIRALNAEPPG